MMAHFPEILLYMYLGVISRLLLTRLSGFPENKILNIIEGSDTSRATKVNIYHHILTRMEKDIYSLIYTNLYYVPTNRK